MAFPLIPAVIIAATAVAGASAAAAHGKAKADRTRKSEQEILDDIVGLYENMSPAEQEAALAQEVGFSEMSGVNASPILKDAQMKALASFEDIQESGGLTLQDRAAQNQALNQSARQEAAGRAAIENNMAARGTLGSGAELAMSLSNQQASADRGARLAENTAASAQARYFDSILAQGNMAGQMRDQDVGEQTQKAKAADMIAQYNAAARERALNQRNANRNTQWGQQMAIAQAKGGAMGDKAESKSKQADRTQAFWGGIGNTILKGGGIAAGGMGGGGGGGGADFGGGGGDGASYGGPMSRNAPQFDGGFDEDGTFRGGW